MTLSGEPNPGWPVGCRLRIADPRDYKMFSTRTGTYLGESRKTTDVHRLIRVRPTGRKTPRVFWAGWWRRI